MVPFLRAAVREFQFQAMRRYAQWRIGATFLESRSYNRTDRILLTFDDFGDEPTVRGILQILANNNIKAAIFLQGDWVEQHPYLVQLIKDSGHWLGNHTYGHARLTGLNAKQIGEQLSRGVQTRLMRPPYGAYDARVRKIVQALGFKIAFWTIDSDDWKGISAEQMCQTVLPRLHPGACILLHLNALHTLEALPKLIQSIRDQGYEFCHEGTEIQFV